MSRVPLFNDEQLAFVRKQYLGDGLHPRQIAPIINAKFGTAFSQKQILNLVRDRGWSKRKKAMLSKVPNTEALVARAEKSMLAAVQREADAFLAQCSQLGQEAVNKAHEFIRGASSAKALSSAVNAARGAIGIKRQAIGMDGSAGTPGSTHYYFNFAKGDGSPFNPKPVTQAAVVEVEAESVEDV